ncbi:MAG: hypothetical protein GY949_21670, partial [Gammaproteobacteria bacterium]|nr:hypothetical protein [Gammaproteobacteria bacterium]
MAEYFVLRLERTSNDAVEWMVADDSGTRRSHSVTGSLADAAKDAGGRPVIVLVPGTEVLTTSVDIPVGRGTRLNAALPFALEENLAEDVEKLHFAAGPRRENGVRPVSVVAREKMDEWLQQLREADINAVQLVAENYGLARIPGTLSILIAGDCVMFNDGADTEFVMQGVLPSDTLVAAGLLSDRNDDDQADMERPGHLVAYCDPADEERFSHDWIALRQELHSVDINLLPDGVLPRLAVTVASGSGVNLLQGDYGTKTDYRLQFRPWRNAAMLLVGLLVVSLIAKGVDIYRLTEEDATWPAQFAEEYRPIRPGDTREIL